MEQLARKVLIVLTSLLAIYYVIAGAWRCLLISDEIETEYAELHPQEYDEEHIRARKLYAIGQTVAALAICEIFIIIGETY